MKRRRTLFENRFWKRIFSAALFGAVCLSLVLSPAFLFGRTPPAWAPVALQNWAFDVRLVITPPMKKALSISAGSYKDDRAYLDDVGRDVTFTSQGLTMAGTVYEPPTAGPHPGILLLHGSTPEGRKLGLYRLLGKKLAERDYVALSVDRRGYGESDDPPEINSLDDLAPVADFTNAIDYLASLDIVDPDRLYTIGHSEGTDLAITAGIQDPRVLKIVAIGPSRRVQERLGAESDPEWDYFQRRAMRYMNLVRPVPDDVTLEARANLTLESHLDYFSRSNHKPLLLIDGALESEADREFLQDLCATISDPRECMTLPNADHYANVANLGSLVLYDERVIAQLVDEIDDWLTKGGP